MSRRMEMAKLYEKALFAGDRAAVGKLFHDDIVYWASAETESVTCGTPPTRTPTRSLPGSIGAICPSSSSASACACDLRHAVNAPTSGRVLSPTLNQDNVCDVISLSSPCWRLP
jgi:hypothetical protein